MFLVLSLIGLFALAAPKKANAVGEGCITVVFTCPDGSSSYCVICDKDDVIGWASILCGVEL